MTTKIEKTYLDKLRSLAKKFAIERSLGFVSSSQTKVRRSTYDIYMAIGIYLYLRLGHTSVDITDFNFNRIHSRTFKAFSCKLYKKILDDLVENQMIRRNDHYNHMSQFHRPENEEVHQVVPVHQRVPEQNQKSQTSA